ncbi:MAG: hypothetical protein Q4B58_08930 [Bacteroidales bacterium]|nr:hypothetical protein [Bacteroidales bacterium]
MAWIDDVFCLHLMAQVEESVSLNDSSKPTSTDNQPAGSVSIRQNQFLATSFKPQRRSLTEMSPSIATR